KLTAGSRSSRSGIVSVGRGSGTCGSTGLVEVGRDGVFLFDGADGVGAPYAIAIEPTDPATSTNPRRARSGRLAVIAVTRADAPRWAQASERATLDPATVLAFPNRSPVEADIPKESERLERARRSVQGGAARERGVVLERPARRHDSGGTVVLP